MNDPAAILDRYRRYVAALQAAVDAQDFARFRRTWLHGEAIWPCLRREIADGATAQEDLADLGEQVQTLARKLRQWQQQTKDTLTATREKRQRRNRLKRAYRAHAGKPGKHVILNS